MKDAPPPTCTVQDAANILACSYNWVRWPIEDRQLKPGCYASPTRVNLTRWVDRADAEALKIKRANITTTKERS